MCVDVRTMMPCVGREAAAWEEQARAYWAQAGSVSASVTLEAALGSSDALTGKGSSGTGVTLDLITRRAVPVH
jgi:hypothetical protein